MLKVPEIAARMRVSEYTVRRWLRSRRLRGILIGRKVGWRIPVSEFQRFIREEMGTE